MLSYGTIASGEILSRGGATCFASGIRIHMFSATEETHWAYC